MICGTEQERQMSAKARAKITASQHVSKDTFEGKMSRRNPQNHIYSNK